MPKMKTNRAACKRFRKTATSFKCGKAGHNHILTKKNAKRKARLTGSTMVNKSDEKSVARMFRDL